MANPKHLELARQGKDAWNKWRAENPDEHADFSGADFTQPENKNISFAGFEFGDEANFMGAAFGHEANFEGAAFGKMAFFAGAAFGSRANFRGAAFGIVAFFADAVFGDGANFEGAAFGDRASFADAAFGIIAFFADAVFGDGASFRVGPQAKVAALREQVEKGLPEETKARRAKLRKDADPEGFSWIDFTGAKFRGEVTFQGRIVRERATFAHVRFGQPPDFWAVENRERLDLTGARFGLRGFIVIPERLRGVFGGGRRIPTPGWTMDTKIADDLRRLRKIASEVHATDAERDLFILERMAERGVLWMNWWGSGWKWRLFGWWRPASATVLMFLYWALSNCGRSVVLPILWFIAANFGAYYVYSRLADTPINEALRNLTFANMLPFGTLAKPLSEHAAVELFYGGVLPPAVGLAAIGQGVVNALLVFLLALALRNHFKVK